MNDQPAPDRADGALDRNPPPPRLERLWRTPLGGWLLTGGLLTGLVALIAAFGGASLAQVATTFLIYVVLATGVQLFMGTTGIATFGHLAFAAIGGYAAALVTIPPALKQSMIPEAPGFILDAHGGYLLGTVVGVVIAIIVAAIIGLAFVRLSRDTLPLATLGLLVVVSVVATNWTAITNGQETLYGIPTTVTLWPALAFALVALAVARVFRDSRLGLALRATSADELAAAASGVRVVRARYAAWVISAAVVAAGGALYVHSLGVASPSFFYFDLTFTILTIVIIGGSSISGVLAGALVFTTVTEVLRRVINGIADGRDSLFALVPIGPALIVIVLLILRPQGLLGRWELEDLLGRLRRSGADGVPPSPGGGSTSGRPSETAAP